MLRVRDRAKVDRFSIQRRVQSIHREAKLTSQSSYLSQTEVRGQGVQLSEHDDVQTPFAIFFHRDG